MERNSRQVRITRLRMEATTADSHTDRETKRLARPAAHFDEVRRMTKLSVAIIGAGMGGLATAAALHRAGIEANVYEQASKFTRLGAGIQIGCNAVKVLRGRGAEGVMRSQSFYPRSWNNREYDTGDIRFDMIFGEVAEERYGAPYLLGHRGDLHSGLASAVPDEAIHLSHKLTGFEQNADGSVSLTFANGNKVEADAVVSAD